MHFAGITVLYTLLLVIVLLTGWVIFNIARIVISIFRQNRRQRGTFRQVQHPELGSLTSEDDMWSGQILREGRTIPFVIVGTEAGPDAVLVERLRSAVARFPEIEREALEFIRAQTPEHNNGKFTFESLDFLWEQKPDDFALEFNLTGDDDGAWRVEFQEGRPRFLGRDD